MEDYMFKKSTCETYTIRWGVFGWAVFAIDEETGLFNCQSDYGDYNYMWPNHGRKSFKHFIIELAEDTHYLLKKVSKDDSFNYEKTIESWKNLIIEIRKERICTKEKARGAWDVVINLDDFSGSPDMCQREVFESDEISHLYPEPWYVFDAYMEYPLGARAFAHEIMPIFADLLRKEIESKEALFEIEVVGNVHENPELLEQS